MVSHGKPFASLSDLRMFVNETICGQEELEVGAFQNLFSLGGDARVLQRCPRPGD